MTTKKKQNILITGASSGIGEALARHYAITETAANLFISGRDPKRLEAVQKACERYNIKVYAKILDVTNKEATISWIQECENIAPLNIVYANAGVATLQEIPENIYNTFNTNVFGVLNTIIPAMEIYKNRKDKNKTLVIMSSIAGYHGLPSCPSYSASKACVKAYGEALRSDLKPYNIQVNVVCPGFVKSRITDKNTCPMPFFMPAEKAAKIIAERVENNIGLIAFPWPMRLATWLMSILPNCLSDFIYAKLPHKV